MCKRDKLHNICLRSISDNVDIHTPLMREFLEDKNENCIKYADGFSAQDKPQPVRLSWKGADGCHYIITVIESGSMEKPWVFETDDCFFDVYNLKIGTSYYWTVAAIDKDGEVFKTNSEVFKTLDAAPRNLYVGGNVMNIRDIGGWRTEDGKRVKQGLVYRSSAYDAFSVSGNKMVEYLTSEGKAIMKNLLGIKTEIDLRVDHKTEEEYPPEEKTSSILGENVAYYHAPILLGPENYLNSISSIKTIFGVLENPDNYPLAYHCAVGADRTGMVTYMLNGLLGVSRENLVRDYMITNFSYQQKYRAPLVIGYVETIDNYGGESLKEKIYNYLVREIGIPAKSLDFIINYLTD